MITRSSERVSIEATPHAPAPGPAAGITRSSERVSIEAGRRLRSAGTLSCEITRSSERVSIEALSRNALGSCALIDHALFRARLH